MKINSWKKAILSGIVYGAVTFAVYVLFTCILYYFLGGENFVYKDETRDIINGLSFNTTKIIATIISTLIPMLLLRCKSGNYYIVSIFVAIVLYIILFMSMYIAPSASKYMFELIEKSPMNSFDALIYGAFSFPFGGFVGMVITPVINYFIYRKKD